MKPKNKTILLLVAGAVAISGIGMSRSQDLSAERAAASNAKALMDNNGNTPTPTPKEENPEEEYASSRESIRLESNDVIRAKFLSRARQLDPFGAPINVALYEGGGSEAASLGAMRGASTQADGSTETPEQRATRLFTEAISTMQIGALNPDRREFLIGADNFYEGDAIDMHYKGQAFRVWIREVSANHIVLLEQSTKTMCEVRFNSNEAPLVHGKWGSDGTISQMPNY